MPKTEGQIGQKLHKMQTQGLKIQNFWRRPLIPPRGQPPATPTQLGTPCQDGGSVIIFGLYYCKNNNYYCSGYLKP